MYSWYESAPQYIHDAVFVKKKKNTIFLINKMACIKCIEPFPSLYFTYQWFFKEYSDPVGAIYCSLIEFNCQKESLLHQMIHPGKEIRRHYINGTGKGFVENCITVSYTSSACNAVSYAIATAMQTYNIATGTVCTDSA